MRSSVLIFALLFFNSFIFAQTSITGRVVDASTREPLEHAFVSVKNSNIAVLSNFNGEFSITASAHDTLVISYIGHTSVEIRVAELRENNSIALAPGVLNLQEVKVVNQQPTRFNSISRIDLNLRPAKSSQEILRVVPGLFIGQHAGGGKAEQIFLRGFDIDHGTDIDISVDGIPVNMVSHAHGQGYADMHFIIPELIKNADYGLGPYYTGHGNLAVAGYVALNTVNSLPNNTVKLEAGQFNTLRGLALINLLGEKAKAKNQHWYMAGEYLYSDGPFISPQKFHRYNLFSKFSSPLNAANMLSIQASTFNSKWYASGQIPNRAVESGLISRFGSIDDKEGGNTGRTNLSATLSTRLNRNAQWNNQLYYSRYDFNLFSNFTFFLEDPINGDEINQKEKRDLFGYRSTLTLYRQYNRWQGQTMVGAGFRADRTYGSELSHTKERGILLNQIQLGDISEANIYAYAEQVFREQRWSITIGSRFDHFNFRYTDRLANNTKSKNSKSTTSPKLNIQYTLNSKTQLYLKTGKGFHSNDTRVALTNNNTEILPAAYGADLGILFKPLDKLVVNTALWYLYLQQEFVYVGDAGVVEPSGKTRRMGADVSVRYQISASLFSDVNINWTRPRALGVNKGEDYIPLAPTFSSVGGINYIGRKGINGSIRYRYLKDRPANEDNSVVAKGYTVADLSLNYTRKKYEIGVFIENLFNVKWNETQFDTESRLQNEPAPVSEIHFTPGAPFFARLKFSLFF